jgi:adenylosuccinate synthase
MSALNKLFDRFRSQGVRTAAVVDLQFGDAGKGKFVDSLGEWADVIARGTGGANAGHTIKLGEQTSVFHLVPSGILWDKEGKLNLIGRGVALDPRILASELGELARSGGTYEGLRISHRAHLVLPVDVALDRLRESSRGSSLGTTGRGIGPLYESFVARTGLSVNDLLNRDIFAAKLRRNWEARKGLFSLFDPSLVEEVLRSPALENGIFCGSAGDILDLDAIVERYLAHADIFRELIVDTDELLQKLVGANNVLLEGAQGTLLSVVYGTYPYVTSSDCSLAGLAQGVGLKTEHVDYTLGIAKAPYMSRVGKGPFPTEFGGMQSDEWCSGGGASREIESEDFAHATVNSLSEFTQGVAIRRAGKEYGATTGRARRVGWLDVPLLRYAAGYSGCSRGALALTKVDVMSECKVIKLCTAHRFEGPPYWMGDDLLTSGRLLETAVMDTQVLGQCAPIYKEMPGWECSLDGMRSESELPAQLRSLVSEIAARTKVAVEVVSIGPERDETVVL